MEFMLERRNILGTEMFTFMSGEYRDSRVAMGKPLEFEFIVVLNSLNIALWRIGSVAAEVLRGRCGRLRSGSR